MSKFDDKVRNKFADAPEIADFAPSTLAWVIQIVADDRNQLGGRPHGKSHGYTLRLVQRWPIGAKPLAALKQVDFLNHCKMRRAAGVLPQTIMQDMTYTSGVLKYAHEILELEGAKEALEAYKKAVPQLKKEQLIAKSQPRDRRPTQEELDIILAECALPPKKKTLTLIPMVPIVKFSYLAGRRISETCRITWGDLDHEKRICRVRDLKNSKGKGFHDVFPLLGEAWDIVMAQPRANPNDPNERIFPFNAQSCGAKYTRIKKRLTERHPGMFVDLHLHDNRRHCFSNLFEEGYSVPEVQKVSLHRNATILLKNYTALRPEDLHLGPAAKRLAA